MPDALRAAVGIADPILASKLLAPLPLESLGPGEASLFGELLPAYGLEWSIGALAALSVAHGEAHVQWLTRLPEVCEELSRAGDDGSALARSLVTSQWAWIANELRLAERERSPSRASAASSALVAPLLALLQAATLADAEDIRDAILRDLVAAGSERRVEFLVEMLRAARSTHLRRALLPLRAACAESITRWLREAPRRPGDWSIRTETGCACALCATLQAFLSDSERRVLEWPLAKERRAHIHGMIESHELPLTHHTRRTGSPFTLVLTKRDTLFALEAAQRKRWTKDLEWLKKLPGGWTPRRP
jgi:hypothetical protein